MTQLLGVFLTPMCVYVCAYVLYVCVCVESVTARWQETVTHLHNLGSKVPRGPCSHNGMISVLVETRAAHVVIVRRTSIRSCFRGLAPLTDSPRLENMQVFCVFLLLND